MTRQIRKSSISLVSVALACTFAASLCECSPVLAAEKAATEARNVFQRALFADEQHRHILDVLRLFRLRRYGDAEAKLNWLISTFPDWPKYNYLLAAAQAQQDKTDEALDSLKLALSKGFSYREAVEKDPLFNTLRGLPQFQALLDGVQRRLPATLLSSSGLSPKPVKDGIALVDETNTVWEPTSETLISAFSFPDSPHSDRVRGSDDAISRRLNLLYGRGEAAGNHGDLYDNRDNGHSPLRPGVYPQLTRVKYAGKAIAARTHYGVNARHLFNAITIGNSSTAITRGPLRRSLARFTQTNPVLIERAFQHYANDHIYVFPEVGDHDPQFGDLFPANTPYMLVSQGSSGSDQPILDALAAILAALQPSVKKFLKSKHLVMPTVQMIFRSGLKPLQSPDEYLTNKAHPAVFNGTDLDVRRMIFVANKLREEEIPPRVNLNIVQESLPTPGINYFGPSAQDEVLFTTPSAIARIVRSTDLEKRMLINTSGTTDPNGRPLRFEWKVLQGDSNLIEIKKLKQDGSEVELKVKWHERRQATSNPAVLSSRVDIAVFAHNGFNYSAPAFISLAYPTRHQRTYDRSGRIREIVYDQSGAHNLYQDPVIFPRRGWRDLYAYTKQGQFIGWDRISNNRIENFTRDGARVTKKDDLGRAVMAERVVYSLKPGVREVVARPTGEILLYRYEDREDRIGVSIPVSTEQ